MLASDSKNIFHGFCNHKVTSDQSPTDFWLDTYTVAQVLDTPELISSLASYSDQLQEATVSSVINSLKPTGEAQSILFLRIQAAASYYSTNRTLMDHPPPVDVDISKSSAVVRLFEDANTRSPRPLHSEPCATLPGTCRCIHYHRCCRSLVRVGIYLPLASFSG